MQSPRASRRWRAVGVLITGLWISVSVPAWASPVPVEDEPPTTVTVPTPTSLPPVTPPATTPTVPSTNPSPPTTKAPRGDGTTTTSSTTTTAPPLDPNDQNYAATPAPEVPSASSDPLFHAARTVDADLRDVDLARAAFKKAKAHSLNQNKVAAKSLKRTDAQRARDNAARSRRDAAQTRLKAASLYAYTGYGTERTASDHAEIHGATTVLPYVTYVRVTVSEATRDVAEHNRAVAATSAELASRKASSDRDARQATEAKRAYATAKKTLVEAKDKLKRDMDALQDLVASLSDLAPGSLQQLPEDFKLPEGAHLVESPAGSIVVPAKADPRTVIALQFIIGQLGKRYVWGGTGPSTYDCSGLMLRAYQAAGVTSMPRVSQAQQVWATPVPALEAQPGDLVFFGTPAYHVGVYIGGGLMINAPFTGTVVRVDKVWSSVSGFGRPVWSTAAPTG